MRDCVKRSAKASEPDALRIAFVHFRKLVFVNLEAHNLPTRMDTCIGSAGASRLDGTAQQHLERTLELALNSQLLGLPREPREGLAPIGNLHRKSVFRFDLHGENDTKRQANHLGTAASRCLG